MRWHHGLLKFHGLRIVLWLVYIITANILTRTIGESILLFLWTSGKVTTESRPMDVVTLDEVQEMTLDQIDKVLNRLGDSHIDMALFLSTANMPDLDINYWYQLGTQEEWHTECPHCKALSDLSDPVMNFPKRSIAYNTGQIEGAPLNPSLIGPWMRLKQQAAQQGQGDGAPDFGTPENEQGDGQEADGPDFGKADDEGEPKDFGPQDGGKAAQPQQAPGQAANKGP